MRKFLVAVLALASTFLFPATATAAEAELYFVSFTADWCPNCAILDPKMDAALERFDRASVQPVVLDMTDARTREASYNKIDGTVLAGVYGDHLGVTGIGIMTAADSGEKLGCVTRDFSTEEIASLISQAVENVRTQTPLQRSTDLGRCPDANGKVAL